MQLHLQREVARLVGEMMMMMRMMMRMIMIKREMRTADVISNPTRCDMAQVGQGWPQYQSGDPKKIPVLSKTHSPPFQCEEKSRKIYSQAVRLTSTAEAGAAEAIGKDIVFWQLF